MRKLLVLLPFFSLAAVACGKSTETFAPFVIEKPEYKDGGHALKVYEIFAPVQKGDSFLNGVTASVVGEFIVNLDIRDDYEYVGDYYTAYISVPSKHVENLVIRMAYNATNKERSVFSFCANFKTYKLPELLSLEPVEKAPVPPAPPPPPPPKNGI